MSRVVFDFLADSPIFVGQSIESYFKGFTDAELEGELARYREHVIKNAAAINAEIVGSAAPHRLSIYFDTSAREVVANELLVQCALYYDRAIVDDPLFALTTPHSKQGAVMRQYYGFGPGAVDRKRIAKAAGAMLEARPMVVADFLIYAPISVLHEPPENLPLLYSETLHAERIPDSLRGWIRERASVHSLRRDENGNWFYRDGDPLVPSRGIAVGFPDHLLKAFYFLSEAQIVNVEGDRFEFVQHLPEVPPTPDRFAVWVEQSINLTGGAFLDHISADLVSAANAGSMLLTRSPLVADLLALQFGENESLKADVARLALSLRLPYLQGVSIEQLMHIRSEEGEAFQNFRRSLETKLRELRTEVDEEKVRIKLQNIEHELLEVQVAEVNREVRRFERNFAASALVGAASLVAVLPSGGVSLSTLIAAAASGYKSWSEFQTKVREHPAYFLWRLGKSR